MNKTRRQKAQRVTLVGAAINILLSVGKIMAGLLGKSSAMIADGIHSMSDLVTDVIVVLFFRISDAEKDDTHPYGHGKFETFSTFLIALILLGVGFGIFYNGINKVISVIQGEILPKPQMIAFWVALISIICKEGLYHYTKKVGKQIDSSSIIANAWHHRSDAFSSIGVTIGIAGAIFLGDKWVVLDPIAGVIVSAFIMKTAIEISLPCIHELTESSLPKEIVQKIEVIIMEDDEILSFHKLRTRKNGNVYVIDVHLQLKNFISLEQAHRITGALSQRIRSEFGNKTLINIHTEPCEESLKGERHCSVHDITQELFSGKIYSGDPHPSMTRLLSIENGDDFNLSTVNLCVHNATHIDAPSHFIDKGISVDEIVLEKCIGHAEVVDIDGAITEKKMRIALQNRPSRILFKNSGEMTPETAILAIQSGVQLIGTELQSIGDYEVHRLLLEQGVVLLEGVVLTQVKAGVYFLFAAPLKLAGAEGSPCRAVLLEN